MSFLIEDVTHLAIVALGGLAPLVQSIIYSKLSPSRNPWDHGKILTPGKFDLDRDYFNAKLPEWELK